MVAEAQAAGITTSGAQSGGKIASFLERGDDTAEGDAVIDQLVARKPAETAGHSPATGKPAAPEPKAHDESVIGSLTDAAKRKPDSTPAPSPQEQADTGLIDSLIQKKDADGKPK